MSGNLEADRRDKVLDEMSRQSLRASAWEGATYMAVEHLLDFLEALNLSDALERDVALKACYTSARTFVLSIDRTSPRDVPA